MAIRLGRIAGAALVNDEICFNEVCSRQSLEITADSAEDAADTAKNAAEQQRGSILIC